MAHQTTKNVIISCRLALFTSAGALVGTLVSAATPIGPREARLRARLRAMVASGPRDIRISWQPAVARLPRRARARLMLEYLNAPGRKFDRGDRSAAAA
jgi:hypothetical protein